MRNYQFVTDKESRVYVDAILDEMVRLFSIPEEEALGRINRAWKALELIGDEDLIYHEDEEYWAKTIYYGKDSEWWNNPPSLRPLPYHEDETQNG